MATERTVRVDESTHAALCELKAETGRSMTELLAQAVERFQEQAIVARMNAGYARLREDEAGSASERRERGLWDSTVADGLEPRVE